MVEDLNWFRPRERFDIDADIHLAGDGTDDEPRGIRQIEAQRGLWTRNLRSTMSVGNKGPSVGRDGFVARQHLANQHARREENQPITVKMKSAQPLDFFRGEECMGGPD